MSTSRDLNEQFGRETINPYRHAVAEIISRLRWDLQPESWRSRRLLKQQKNQYVGKRCVILCNGPSLNKVDFDLLSDFQKRDQVIVIGLNKIHLLFARTKFRPDLIASVNRLVIEQTANFFNGTSIPLYLVSNALDFVSPRANVAFMQPSCQRKFCRDISLSINLGYTVTFVAMQLAYHLGIRDLALVGCDHNFATKGPANTTSEVAPAEKSHFDPTYYEAGQKWQLPDLAASEYHYSMAAEVFSASLGRVVNCTQGGKLDLYARMDLIDWLAEGT